MKKYMTLKISKWATNKRRATKIMRGNDMTPCRMYIKKSVQAEQDWFVSQDLYKIFPVPYSGIGAVLLTNCEKMIWKRCATKSPRCWRREAWVREFEFLRPVNTSHSQLYCISTLTLTLRVTTAPQYAFIDSYCILSAQVMFLHALIVSPTNAQNDLSSNLFKPCTVPKIQIHLELLTWTSVF